jgi:diaminopropionate ammonia-lyase
MRYDLVVNPFARPELPDDRSPAGDPRAFHSRLPGYAPTPLLDSASLARRLGVRHVLVKLETHRLGLPSFKILGASWATVAAVREAWLDPGQGSIHDLDTLRRLVATVPGRRLAAATDGNHGRGVARMAALLGLECTILVPAGTARARIDAIVGEGAEVGVVDGSYDDAVAASARLADERTLVVSDTSWEGYEDVPRAVIAGYSTMFAEVDDARAAHDLPPPTVVALQAGVGAFAAAGLRHVRSAGRPQPRPRTVVVEPDTAHCLMTSARAGGITEVPGPHPSTMAGLNCGLPSVLAWPTVRDGTDVFVAVDDAAAFEAMRALATAGVEAGESGAASLAALLAVAEGGDAADRAVVGLVPDAVVLLVVTEGPTDPDNWASVVGRAPATAGIA